MNDPEVVVIGAGAMGGSMAGALLRAGALVTIIDTDAEHVAAIRQNGLKVVNLEDGGALPVTAMTAPVTSGWADLAIVMTPTYEREAGAATAARVLKPGGSAASLQNGLGNAEALIDAVGEGRVFMGSSRASADMAGPGCPRITKLDPLTLGEFDGETRPRTRWLADALTRGGMPTGITDNITGVLWSKFIANCCINAFSAITGLRMGEIARTPGLAELRWEVVDEVLAVVRAKGVRLPDPDPAAALKAHVWRKFTKPSMLQMMEMARPIEIDAINGHLVREAEALGIDVPVNRVLTALARGRSLAVLRDAGAAPDYAALTAKAEAEIDRGETPWEDQQETPT